MVTTAELTEGYISEHRSIKDCLKKGLINYSALSRRIARELGIKDASKEAILIAARRYKEKIKDEAHENNIIGLFKNSNIEIKNNIVTYTLKKNVYLESLIEVEKEIKKGGGLFFSIEGTKTITIILQKQNKKLMESKLKNYILTKKEDLSLITINSPGIEKIAGAVSYITGLFFENDINIEEFMSCYEDTLIVINTPDVEKIIKHINF